jgi:hypothetical protein
MGLFRRKPKWNSQHIATIPEAMKILGDDRVITAQDVYKVRGIPVRLEPVPQFLAITLEKCAKQNKRGEAQWYLVYIIGESLVGLFDRYGSNSDCQPCFLDQDIWSTEMRGTLPKWATTCCDSGYRLINFRLKSTEQSFDVQARELKQFGAEYERITENVLVEGLFTLYQTRGLRFLEKGFHQGPDVRLGIFDEKGIMIFNIHLPHILRKDTGVVANINPHTDQWIAKHESPPG